MKKHFLKVALGFIGLMGALAIGVVNAQEINKDIKLEATSTAANQKIKINKYFANAYTVDRGDGTTGNLTADTTHTYATAGTYTITLSLAGGADRWTFQNVSKPLVPTNGTTMTGVKITSMPSLEDGFGANATAPGNYFFYRFNYNGALTSLPDWSFDTSKITTVGNSFFSYFNYNGALTSLPNGSFDISNISGSIGDTFFDSFNAYGALTSLPNGSFDISNITMFGDRCFAQFNSNGKLTGLPGGSFIISNVTKVGYSFFDSFNKQGEITSLPEGSFDTSNIITWTESFFYGFNANGKLTNLPYSFTIRSNYDYGDAFNSPNYTINRNVSDLVSGIVVPYYDRNTFSDNQPGRCGVHANWLVTTANACNIRYDANGGNGSVTGGYNADTTGVVAGSGITAPTRAGYIFDGWTNASGDIVEEVTFPEMDGETLYAKWRGKDIILQATSTAANQKIQINKYFSNAYTVDWGDGTTGNLIADTTHTYATPGTYTITLSLSGADRWTFKSNTGDRPLVPQEGTTMTGVMITYMPSLADGFGNDAMSVGNYFFEGFNAYGALTSLPTGSFDISNITSAGNRFFYGFNAYGALTSLPTGSFRFSTGLTLVGNDFFHSFNQNGQLTNLPGGSFNTENITSVGSAFFRHFNWGGMITSLPTGSFDISHITVVGDEFFRSFNYSGGALTSLPDGSFRLSTGLTSVGNYFFNTFNAYGGELTSLPENSFNTENITSVGNYFFSSFNGKGAIESLPEGSFRLSTGLTSVGTYFFAGFISYSQLIKSLPDGSFDLSHITTVGNNFFTSFNRDGALENLPSSFKLSSAAYNKTNAYQNAFNSPNYEINKKVSDIVSGVTSPSSDQDTFSDNQPGRCGVHANWLVSTADACSISYDDGQGGTGEFKYSADTTGVVVGSGMLVPSREGYTFSGWLDASGNKVDEIVFPDMDGETLYANWEANIYTITLDIDGTLTTITGSYGSPIIPPANPIKNGYKFAGWEPEIPAIMPAKDMTIKAKWEKNGSSGGGGGGGGGSNKASDTEDSQQSGENSSAEQASVTPQNDSSVSSGTNTKEPESITGSNIQTGSQIDSQNDASSGTDARPAELDKDIRGDTQNSSDKSSSEGQTYTQEFQEAYEFAKEKGITTMPTIQKADMDGKLTRIAMAKMLSQYAINVLGMTPDVNQNNKFNDVTEKMDSDYDDGVTLAYQLGIMGQNMPNNKFRPNDEVTRGEFVTALSRMLYNTSDGEYRSTPKYYTHHMEKMEGEGIITNTNPNMKELRGYVMIMLMRSAK